MINFQSVLVYSDQPVTCPKCGSRTDIVLDLSHTTNQIQIHQCLFSKCRNEFVVVKDE